MPLWYRLFLLWYISASTHMLVSMSIMPKDVLSPKELLFRHNPVAQCWQKRMQSKVDKALYALLCRLNISLLQWRLIWAVHGDTCYQRIAEADTAKPYLPEPYYSQVRRALRIKGFNPDHYLLKVHDQYCHSSRGNTILLQPALFESYECVTTHHYSCKYLPFIVYHELVHIQYGDALLDEVLACITARYKEYAEYKKLSRCLEKRADILALCISLEDARHAQRFFKKEIQFRTAYYAARPLNGITRQEQKNIIAHLKQHASSPYISVTLYKLYARYIKHDKGDGMYPTLYQRLQYAKDIAHQMHKQQTSSLLTTSLQRCLIQ